MHWAEKAQSVQRRPMVWVVGGSILDRVRYFALLQSVQTKTGAHPASNRMETGGSFLGGKAAYL
jgi:hypothetical protein